ncbi:relaxase/mobilization nuclease domain-containing protein [Sphingomonas aquatilis]|uniref:relaxase/mobilization nuclease domain-containing protein n=1 Tax=Sphingomonas aquatilis TaxID=93063 RepID=UPI0023F84CFC|nr:relaxase/mobilization nuclease domain-containing protein [Sphingomonas aquatilis]MCI4652607.1 relaxase/mobilization nuclease domain-containing protein [Sphingomonas aquatilis]
MIIVAISHRNRQQRRAMARALEKQVSRATGAEVRAHFIALVNYLRDADPAALELLGLADHAEHALLGYVTDQAHGGEKVDLIGYRNVTPQFDRAQAEMLAQIARARGTDPIEHYVISWAENEHPTPEQVEEALTLLMRVLNLEEHQAIYAAHRNTRHYHVHVAVNRVHPETGTVVAAGDGWQLNAAGQAAALIEHRQGWSAEAGAQYQVDADGVRHIDSGRLVRHVDGRATAVHPPDRRTLDKPVDKRLSRGARGYEARTGRMSFERIAMTIAAPIIARARSWDELHEGLGKEGLGYARYGTNGARITMGEREISASIAARDAALTQLAQADRLGAFRAGTPEQIVRRKPRYLPGQERRPGYEAARAAHAGAVTAAREQLGAQRAQARAAIIAWQRSFAAQINASDWRGRRDQLNAARQLFGMHFAGIERELMAATAPAVAALNAAARFPSYDEWCAGASVPSVPQALGLAVPMVVASSGDHAAAGVPVAGYAWHRDDGACIYRRVDQPGPAFTDHGPTLAIHTLQRADVMAALKLAQQKWGTVELIAGSDAFLRTAVEVAEAEKITLTGKLAARTRHEIARDAARSTLPAPQVPAPTIEVAPTSSSAVSLPSATTMFHSPSPASPSRDEMRGEHPAVDAWLDEWRRDPKAVAKLRPLAAKAVADPKARNLLDQWVAEGLPAAMRLRQHAGDHARMLAAQAQAPGRGLELR